MSECVVEANVRTPGGCNRMEINFKFENSNNRASVHQYLMLKVGFETRAREIRTG